MHHLIQSINLGKLDLVVHGKIEIFLHIQFRDLKLLIRGLKVELHLAIKRLNVQAFDLGDQILPELFFRHVRETLHLVYDDAMFVDGLKSPLIFEIGAGKIENELPKGFVILFLRGLQIRFFLKKSIPQNTAAKDRLAE